MHINGEMVIGIFSSVPTTWGIRKKNKLYCLIFETSALLYTKEYVAQLDVLLNIWPFNYFSGVCTKPSQQHNRPAHPHQPNQFLQQLSLL